MRIRPSLRRCGEWLSGGRPRSRWPRQAPRLGVEALEDRTTPTIVFTPTFGSETTTTDTTGDHPLGNAHPYLIFWGPNEWGNGQGGLNATAAQFLTAATQALFSPYPGRLSQYPPGPPLGSLTGIDALVSPDPLINGFTTDDVSKVVEDAVDNGLPEPDDVPDQPIYVVVTPPGVSSKLSGFTGYHFIHVDDDTGFPSDDFPVVWASTGNPGDSLAQRLDTFTPVLSRQVVDTITDPNADPGKQWLRATQGQFYNEGDHGGGAGELADFEAPDHTYRVQGSLVQSYWSDQDGAFIVPDGTTQKFFVTGGKLIVNGDQQLAKNLGNDSVTLDVSPAGGVVVTLNGETATFEKGAITSVEVDTLIGNNTVSVLATPNGVPVQINDGGDDAVMVGSDGVTPGTLQNLNGAVMINNPSHHTTLTVDNGADPTSHFNAVINNAGITGLAPAAINYTGSQLTRLKIFGGQGSPSDYYVQETPGGPVGTDGTVGVPVDLTVGGSPTSPGDPKGTGVVIVGKNGSLDAIQGQLTVTGLPGATAHLYAFDWASNDGHSYALNKVGLTRDGIAPIDYVHLADVDVFAGTGDDQLASNAPAVPMPTFFFGGGGNDKLVANDGLNAWTIDRPDGGSHGNLSFRSVPNLVGGPGDDTFSLKPTGSISGLIDGGPGSNTLDYLGYVVQLGVPGVTVNLATGAGTAVNHFTNVAQAFGSLVSGDKLIGPNFSPGATETLWKITGPGTGSVGPFGFKGFEDLVGGSGVDVFQFGPNAMVSSVDGGPSAGDWLDYSQFNSKVNVNLSLGVATGVAFGAPGKVGDIQNVIGGPLGDTLIGGGLGKIGPAPGNILVGGPGADTLTAVGAAGGPGSVLIGGLGGDTLTGGNADDILIGDRTSYDPSSQANRYSLKLILAEWQSANSYTTRRQHLIFGGGLNGLYTLNTFATVFNDFAVDTLTGQGGQDWFFAFAGDVITDQVLFGPQQEKTNNTWP
jgi:hypothetical protein